MRHLACMLMTVACLVLAGCPAGRQDVAPASPAFTTTPGAAPAPAAPTETSPATVETPEPTEDAAGSSQATAGGNRTEILARVNGQALPMDTLVVILLRAHGMPIARQLISTELVRQEARRRGIEITEADVERENDLAMEETFGQLPQPAQRERMLQQFLTRFQVTRERWNLTMRRNAYLAKMAGEIEISEKDLREAFASRYGRRVVVRTIQTASSQAALRVRAQARRPGADFAELARRHSIHASAQQGGLLPPIGPNTREVPPVLRRAALALTKPGEVSEPVLAGSAYHVLRLERVLEPEDVTFEAVRDELAADLKKDRLRDRKRELLQRLFETADIEWVNPTLKSLANEGAAP